jgi:hypothetical protein
MNDLQPQTLILLFIFFGLAITGAFILGLALYWGAQRVFAKPETAQHRWEREWQKIEEDISK